MNSTTLANQHTVRDTQAAPSRPPCPVCGSISTFRYGLKHTTVFQCPDSGCKLQFASPQLDDHELGKAYAALYYPAVGNRPVVLENASEFEVREFLSAIKGHTGSLQGKRVLDYGCGNGVLLRIVNEMGAEAVGVEQNATARRHIGQSGYGQAYADLKELKDKEPISEFDYIMMCDVVEHLREPWVDLAQLRSLLSDKGRLFMTTPNSNSMRSRLSGARWDQRNNQTHFYYFNSQSLSKVGKIAGFTDMVELQPITTYRHHGFVRQRLQLALSRFGLHGGLLFMATR